MPVRADRVQPTLAQLLGPKKVLCRRRAADWEDAVRQACEVLVRAGDVTEEFTRSAIQSVRGAGPYIVIMPGVALAHARPENNVMKNSIGVATFRGGVSFGNESNDPVYAVFAIAARSDEEHLKLFRALAKFIAEEENVERLKQARAFSEIGF